MLISIKFYIFDCIVILLIIMQFIRMPELANNKVFEYPSRFKSQCIFLRNSRFYVNRSIIEISESILIIFVIFK